MRSRKGLLAIAIVLVLVRLLLGIEFIRANSATGDENLYVASGYILLHTGDYSVNSGHPPLTKLLAGAAASLVWDPPYEHDLDWRGGVYRLYDEFVYTDRVYAALGARGELVTMVARIPGMLLGVALCLLCGLWALRLWGHEAGILALGLAALDPNLLAHSCVVGTDAPLAFFVAVAAYLAWEHARRPSRRLLVGIGLAFGLALATKFSAVVLAPVIAILLACADRDSQGRPWRRLGRTLLAGAVVAGIGFAVLVASYGGVAFYQMFIGLGSQVAHQSSGHPAFLLGELSQSGWWYYFPVAIFAKTPAVTLVVVVAALALWRLRPGRGWLETLALLLPAGLFLAFNVLVSVNPGVRYVLTLYPFLFVAAGHLVRLLPGPHRRIAALIGGLAALAGTTVPSAPHQLAYFSHFIGGPDQGHRWLSDSNVDWGQDLGGLADWLDQRGQPSVYLAYYGRFPPKHFGIRFQMLPAFNRPPVEPDATAVVEPAPRYLAISVTNLHGTYAGSREAYSWLDAHEPVTKIGYSIFIYDLHSIPQAHRHLARTYTSYGYLDLARLEEERHTLGGQPPHHPARRHP